ncbi:MAG TPA: serine/threonine-protein kinase [Bryobacteraceae bacterium]|nr:serine/threonine-protein kinase [Bryobacteraceae bacterium]
MDRADPSVAETVAVERSAAASGGAASSSSVSRISSSSSFADEGRFVPGTLLGGRYRIIGLLGRGGMGEVYRATDLALGQSVALKLLPEEAARDQRLLERFHGEVRIARQVSHPNVCRVYDIGQAEGMPFISMEYVDGEDLASLLLRIGRLPADKALETARKLCAGLSAAHDRGIIHRDLKPQNIMINKRGDVVIMDFGLAAVAEQLSGAEVRNGTPAYMAPEQLRGAEVTVKSDIYALGLVLYELFTGKRPYDARTVQAMLHQQEAAQLTSMTSIAADIDPGVEKAIRRCLDPDPARRPASVLSVAAALPGGDPLAAALAAGELPSPELVASAGKQEGLATRYSIPCLIAIVLCLCAAVVLRQQYAAVMHTPLDNPPEVLAHLARGMASSFGYTKKPADSALSIDDRGAIIDHLRQLPKPHAWDEWLASEAPIRADYRESPSALLADPYGEVTATNPPPTAPGMAHVVLDGAGRLREFVANPYPDAQPLPVPVPPDAVFRAAGLDMPAFTEIPATFVPAAASDQVHSWKGPHPRIPGVSLTLNVASWKGRITQAVVEFDWPKTAAAVPSGGFANRLQGILLLTLSAVGLLFVVLLARRNWRLGRVDRKGALRIFIARCVLGVFAWLGAVHPVPDESMIPYFFSNCAIWLMWGAALALLYVALEPLVRARWPHTIVTWNRLLAGRWLDAQVSSHILIGATAGALIWVAAEGFGDWQIGELGTLNGLSSALGARQWLAAHTNIMAEALFFGLIVFFSICGLRRLVKKDIPAAILASLFLLLGNGDIFTSPSWKVSLIIHLAIYSVLLFVLLRLGLVATMAAVLFIDSTNLITLGADWKTWYAPAGLASFLFLLGIAVFAFWRSLGTRELFRAEAAP